MAPAAARASEAVAAQSEEPTPTLMEEAMQAVETGRYDEAIRLLETVLLSEPGNVQARVELARVLSWQGRMEDSLALYAQAVADSPFDFDLALERARAISWTGDLALAEAAVRAVIETEPENIEANRLLASLLQQQGRDEEAERVLEWVDRLDPAAGKGRVRRVAKETTGEEPVVTEEGDGEPVELALEWRNTYFADTLDFVLLSSRLGLRIPVGRFSLLPYAAGLAATDRSHGWEGATGGGLEAAVQLAESFSLEAGGGALYFLGLGNPVDWSAFLGASWTAASWLWLGARGATSLFGMVGNSLAAQEAGLRSYGGQLMAYAWAGRFSAWGSIEYKALVSAGAEPVNLVSTFSFAPQVRLVGTEHALHLGYKGWFTGFTEPSPAGQSYWSPARYLSNQATLRLEGGPSAAWRYFLEGGGGAGHEFLPASGIGTPQAKEARWLTFPVASAAAGVKGRLAAWLDWELRGWSSFSQRTYDGSTSRYALWNIDLNLTGRW